MRRTLFIFVIILVACIGGMLGAMVALRYVDFPAAEYLSIEGRQQNVLAGRAMDTSYRVPAGMDFRSAARKVTACVVHIRTSYGPGDFSVNALELYFESPARSSGSGVIISDDGYIVTNNHVVEGSSSIEVIMSNNRRYYAKLIGVDPTTDLALLKVRGRNMPFIKYGDSDNLSPGEWVLAVGNPFDLNSTVTAGIVSAKARNIRILNDQNNLDVESFIQTDAAVNPGNSGGALVNLRGELVGINAAIATTTGSYQGYSFAIPVSLVKKVMDDLLEFGQVQRGLLGVQIRDVDAMLSERRGLGVNQGVLIEHVNEGSAAENSGMKSGDVIIGIDGHSVTSVSELQEWVARNRPGNEIIVSFLRDGDQREVKARLRNNAGSESIEKRAVNNTIGGAQFEDVPYKELARLELEGGVRIKSLSPGKWKESGVKKDFIVAFLDKIPVDNVEDLNRILDIKKGGVLIEGYYTDGRKGTFGLEW
jgi:Do/DeqQ family serine protease